jgi:hypothetical protein
MPLLYILGCRHFVATRNRKRNATETWLRSPLLVSFLAVLLAALTGCMRCHSAEDQAEILKGTSFVRVEVTRYYDADKNRVEPSTKVIDQPDAIKTLLAFFPGVGTGRESFIAGGWKTGVEVKMIRADGSTHQVTSDHGYSVWSEGCGDFRLNGSFRDYISTLFAKE